MIGRTLLLTAILPTLAAGPGSQDRDVTLEERVQARRAIERVYHSHRIGASASFEEARTEHAVVADVVDDLRRSRALLEYWRTPLDDEMLLRELQRMSRGSRMPERLRELFAALGDDRRLVMECLARPVLEDRLTRNFFAYDDRIHGEQRRAAESLHHALLSGSIDLAAPHPDRTEVVALLEEAGRDRGLVDADSGAAGSRVDRVVVMPLKLRDYRSWREGFPETVGAIGPIRETRDAFIVSAVIAEKPGEIRAAAWTIEKTSWSMWWSSARTGFAAEPSRPRPFAPAAGPIDVPAAEFHRIVADLENVETPCDSWNNGTLDDVPDPRSRHTAVWTGSEMIVWGGYVGTAVDHGARYDPATDSWNSTATPAAAEPRYGHSAVWTGSEMIVWGGYGHDGLLRTGGRYDPSTDSWEPTTTVSAPSARTEHSAVWTGSEMIVWGGSVSTNGGGRYDPLTDSWIGITLSNAPTPRVRNSAVWTGSEMIVWGGFGSSGRVNTGGAYDPAAGVWSPTSTLNAPSPRESHRAVWTGDRMIAWGGYDGATLVDTGAAYDPDTDTWTPVTTTGAPSGRSNHAAVWSGGEMIVWGGGPGGGGSPFGTTGGRYDPSADSWIATSTTNAPEGRLHAATVWTGGEMIVWGGDGDGGRLGSGGRYDPATDSWTPTSVGDAPDGNRDHSVVWTGNRMLVWGGHSDYVFVNSGGRYDAALDHWSAITTSGAPPSFWGRSAVWTGEEMLIWAGDAGGRYDPVSDRWVPINTQGAPPYSLFHSAAWTGEEMLVWGGHDTVEVLASGGRYDPVADAWTPMNVSTAPKARYRHSTVWSGSEMLVWGGQDASLTYGDGGRYDPSTDSWGTIDDAGAPTARFSHTVVWTGGEMLVWGGEEGAGPAATGGGYDPLTEAWTATSTLDGPQERYGHTATWTGSEMIVWGGHDHNPVNIPIRPGGRYDPTADTWAPMGNSGAPPARYDHSAVWTGREVLVWGGASGVSDLRSGGGYFPSSAAWYRDADGDGRGDPDTMTDACLPPADWVGNAFDCDDSSAAIYPGAPEINDGVDNQCPDEGGLIDELGPDLSFADPGNRDRVSWDAQSGASLYELLRSTQRDFSPCATLATTADTTFEDPQVPGEGGILFYLARASAPNRGSLGADSSGRQRTPLCWP